jgi:hypothetical protein
MDMTSRTDFIETWLAEMPQGLGQFEMFDMIKYHIKDRIKNGGVPLDVGKDIKKISGSQTMFYWFEKAGEIVLAVELTVRPQALVVSAVGKNPRWRGRAPFASDLYDLILNDSGRSLRLFSDESLSDEGYAIWKRLLQKGHKISVYDRENPGKSFVTVDSLADMEKYFAQDDTDFKRYQYVLSESEKILEETKSHFNTRRMRELIPGLL